MRPAVEEFLNRQRFVEAATALNADPCKADADSLKKTAIHVRPTVAGDDPVVRVVTFRTELSRTALTPLKELQARTRAQIACAKLGQSFFVAVLAALVGYGLSAPKFVSDYQDFLLIFSSAFGLDLTADAVAKLAPTARR